MGGIGGGVGRIELGRREDAVAMAGDQIGRIGRVGEIAGHQRREGDAGGNRGADARAIGVGHRRGRHRRRQVRHDDGARELAGGERHHRFEHVAVAEMNVPVVGPADRQCAHLGIPISRSSPRKRGPSRTKTIQFPQAPLWIPACAGMSGGCGRRSGSCFSRTLHRESIHQIDALHEIVEVHGLLRDCASRWRCARRSCRTGCWHWRTRRRHGRRRRRASRSAGRAAPDSATSLRTMPSSILAGSA